MERKRKSRLIAGSVVTVLSLAVFASIAVYFVFGNGLSDISEFLASLTVGRQAVTEYYFETGKDEVVAFVGSSVLSAGKLGAQLQSHTGSVLEKETLRLASPALCVSGNYAILFDIGGVNIKVYSEKGEKYALDTTGKIVTAQINKKGRACIVTQETGGYKGSVTIYNDNGSPEYRFDSAEGYILNAAISNDNKSLAILTLTPSGSQILLIDFKKNSEPIKYLHENSLIFDLQYITQTKILALTKSNAIIIDKKANATELYNFGDRVLTAYCIEPDQLLAIYLQDFKVSPAGELIILNLDDTTPVTQRSTQQVISISAKNGELAVLWSNTASLFNTKRQETILQSPAGSETIIAAGNSTVLFVRQGFGIIQNSKGR